MRYLKGTRSNLFSKLSHKETGAKKELGFKLNRQGNRQRGEDLDSIGRGVDKGRRATPTELISPECVSDWVIQKAMETKYCVGVS